MFYRTWFVGLRLGAVLCFASSLALPQEPGQRPEGSADRADEPIPAEIQQAVADLSSDDFATRDKATELLWAAGPKAIPALRQAAQSDDVETSTRAKNVLSKFKFGILAGTLPEVVQKIERYRYGDNNQKLAVIQELAVAGQIAAVQTLAEAETDEGLKSNIVQIIEKQAGATVPAMLARGDFAKAEEVLKIASTSSQSGMRNYAAYLLLHGGLDQVIAEKSQTGLLNEADYALLSLLHRAAGNLEHARLAAEKAGDPAHLLLPILLEQGDWSELAKRHDEQGREGIEHLGFSAAYHRLAGNQQQFEERIAQIERLIADDVNVKNHPTLIWHAAEALLINDRPAAGLALLKQHRQIKGLELLTLRLNFREALALYGLTDFEAADTWYDGFQPEVAAEAKDDERLQVGLEIARTLHRVDRKEAARKLLSKMAEQNRMDPKKLLPIAQTEQQLGLADEAAQHGALMIAAGTDAELAATQLFSTAAAALWWRIAQKDGAGEEAAASLRRVREGLAAQAKGDSAALAKLAELAADADNVAAATAEEKKSKQIALLTSVADAHRAAGERAKARDWYQKAAAIAGEDDSTRAGELLLNVADTFREEEDWTKAADTYHAVFEKINTRHIAVYMEGYCRAKAGDESEGRRLMDLAALLPLGEAEHRYRLGEGLRQRGIPDAATEQWRITLRTGQHDSIEMSSAAQKLGNALSGEDRMEAADLWQRQLLDCLRTNVHFTERRAYCTLPQLIHKTRAREMLAQGKLEEAVRALELSEAALPGDIRLALDMIPELEQAGRQADADKLFDANYQANLAVVNDFPDSPRFLNQLAWLAANCNRKLDEALVQAERAVALEPDSAAYVDTLAEVHYRRGDTAKALELAKRALELAPDNEEFQQRLKRFEGS